jgi:hypothetical protein
LKHLSRRSERHQPGSARKPQTDGSHPHSPCARYLRYCRYINLGTDNNEVRKRAEEKQDKLGPRWSEWVGKTVHRLVSVRSPWLALHNTDTSPAFRRTKVFLSQAEHLEVSLLPQMPRKRMSIFHHSLVLTDQFVASITTARRSLALPAQPSPAQDDFLWKNVTRDLAQSASGSPSKRKATRRRSSLGRNITLNDDENDAGSVSEVEGSPRKKAKQSKPLSKMNKAEVRLFRRFQLLRCTES